MQYLRSAAAFSVLAIAAIVAASLLEVGRGARAGATIPAEYEPPVAELAAFVERERGLCFRSIPEVHIIRGATEWADAAEWRAQDPVHHVLGFYSVDRDAAFVRAFGPAALVEAVIVHELVHALQWQTFPALHEPHPLSHTAALTDLHEGDADRVMDEYFRLLVEREDLLAETADPWVDFERRGERFARDVHRLGGQSALDAAFSGDLTLEQLSDPEAYVRSVDFLQLTTDTPTRC